MDNPAEGSGETRPLILEEGGIEAQFSNGEAVEQTFTEEDLDASSSKAADPVEKKKDKMNALFGVRPFSHSISHKQAKRKSARVNVDKSEGSPSVFHLTNVSNGCVKAHHLRFLPLK